MKKGNTIAVILLLTGMFFLIMSGILFYNSTQSKEIQYQFPIVNGEIHNA